MRWPCGLVPNPPAGYHVAVFAPGQPPSKPVSGERLAALLERFDVVMDLNMPQLPLSGVEITGRRFFGSNFSLSTLDRCVIRDCTFELCFFDFSTHTGGRYSGIHARNCVFACSEFADVVFAGSDIIQCNFNAIRGSSLVFDDCDLLHSRFDGSTVSGFEIANCNVKETRFLRTSPETVTFRYANQEDAVFVDEDTW